MGLLRIIVGIVIFFVVLCTASYIVVYLFWDPVHPALVQAVGKNVQDPLWIAILRPFADIFNATIIPIIKWALRQMGAPI